MKNDNEYLEPEIDSGKKEEIIDEIPDDKRTDEGARSCKPNYLVTILPGQYLAAIQLATKIGPDDDKGKTL